MKQCRKCGKYKVDDEFPWRNRLLGRRATICKTCTSEQSRDWYQDNRERQLENVKRGRSEARERAREFVFDYLSHHVCEVCGEYRPEALQFDHIRGIKRKDISRMVQDGDSIETIRQEIAKCRVICANCHQMAERRKRGG